jgi:hypothetical protein
MARDRESKGFRPPQGAIDRERFEALVRRVDSLEREVAKLKAGPADEPKPDVGPLVDEALALGVLGPNGKPAARSVLERWKYERLVEAIADIKAASDAAGDEA